MQFYCVTVFFLSKTQFKCIQPFNVFSFLCFMCSHGWTESCFFFFLHSEHTDDRKFWLLALRDIKFSTWMRSDNLFFFFFFDFADPPNYILKLGHIRKYTYINIYHFMSGYTAHVAWSKVAGMKLSFWQPTHFLSACKPLQSRVFLVEQLTVHTNINVWKYLYSATEPSHIWVSGVGMLIKTGRRWRKRPICELEESL